jgi:hypothetical protein
MNETDFPSPHYRERLGRLLVVGDADPPRNKWGKRMVVCVCDCGEQTVVRLDDLTRPEHNIRSCGCLASEETAVRNRVLAGEKRKTLSAGEAPAY